MAIRNFILDRKAEELPAEIIENYLRYGDAKVGGEYQNKFVIEAVNDFYDRCVGAEHDPYRDKEDAFTERIVEAVEKKVMSNLPALFGMYMAQMQDFSLSVPMGAYPVAQGGMAYGRRRRKRKWCHERYSSE